MNLFVIFTGTKSTTAGSFHKKLRVAEIAGERFLKRKIKITLQRGLYFLLELCSMCPSYIKRVTKGEFSFHIKGI